MKTETMRPAMRGTAYALRGEVVRMAKQVAYGEASVRDARRRLVSRATGTFLLHRDQAAPKPEVPPFATGRLLGDPVLGPGPGTCLVCCGPSAAASPTASPAGRWPAASACLWLRSCRCICARCPVRSTRVLMGYKESPVDEARQRFAGIVAAHFASFFGRHRACVVAALGGEVDLVLPVPSSSRPGRLRSNGSRGWVTSPLTPLALLARGWPGWLSWHCPLAAFAPAAIRIDRAHAAERPGLRRPVRGPLVGPWGPGAPARRHLRQRGPGPERRGGAPSRRRPVGPHRAGRPGPAA